MAVSLEKDTESEIRSNLLDKLLPMAQSLPTFTAIEVNESMVDKLRAGFQPDVEMIRQNVLPFLAAGDMIKLVNTGGQLVAVAEVQTAAIMAGQDQDGKTQAAKVLRIFNSTNK